MLSLERIAGLTKDALKSGMIGATDTSWIHYDLDVLSDHFARLTRCFPSNTLHALATKACPLPKVMKLQSNQGMGAEAASLEEVHIALKSGIKASEIIFDGPAKTKDEILFCINEGIYFNLDSFEEVERVKGVFREGVKNFKCGLRINSQVGQGKIAHTSVAGKKSKFGVSLAGNEDLIASAFQEHNWLCGVHSHIGSQGMSLESLVEGTARIWEFSRKLEGLTHIDIGGGLSAYYREGDPSYTIEDYVGALRRRIPDFDSREIQIMTEFGRYVFANSAFAISQIEYIKDGDQIVCHLGADMFMRPVYMPGDWGHRLSVLSSDAELKQEDSQVYRVAGPLCFGGDFLEKNGISLPIASEGDLLVIRDVGAYTLSMWSRHCSRAMPKVIASGREKPVQIIKERESYQDIFEMWGGE